MMIIIYKGPLYVWLYEFTSLTVVQIVGFLILARAVISINDIVNEELFNPILSDSFGFTIKQTSYFFVLLLLADIGGAFLM